jgi:hypothetical protein
VPIDKSGRWWRGTEPADIDLYIDAYSEGGREARRIIHASCSTDGGAEFKLRVDADEGFVERTCTSCGTVVLMLDSADYAGDASPTAVACPCGGTIFNVAVGFAMRDDGSVSWVYNGLRCVEDGTLGVYGEWRIDYEPSGHLLERV